MNTTDPERAAKIAELRKILEDLDHAESELLQSLRLCRQHRESAIRGLAEMGVKPSVRW